MEAQLFLLWAQTLVWTRPEGRLVDRADGDGLATAVSEPDDAAARRLALQVNRAAAFGLSRPLCLVRAVALNRLLTAHGIHGSVVRIGVRLVGGKFTAHAWVEYAGHVIGDDLEHVNRFASLSDVQLLR